MAKRQIATPSAPAAIGPYSQAVEIGPLVFLSGQIPLEPGSGKLVQGSIRDEAHRCLLNLQGVLEAAGLGFADVARTTVFLTDLADFAEVNEVYAGYFTGTPPARSTVQVAALPKGARVEIDAIAVRPGGFTGGERA